MLLIIDYQRLIIIFKDYRSSYLCVLKPNLRSLDVEFFFRATTNKSLYWSRSVKNYVPVQLMANTKKVMKNIHINEAEQIGRFVCFLFTSINRNLSHLPTYRSWLKTYKLVLIEMKAINQSSRISGILCQLQLLLTVYFQCSQFVLTHGPHHLFVPQYNITLKRSLLQLIQNNCILTCFTVAGITRTGIARTGRWRVARTTARWNVSTGRCYVLLRCLIRCNEKVNNALGSPNYILWSQLEPMVGKT